jgi:hypothetical protein
VLSKGDVTSHQNNLAFDIFRAIKVEVFDENGNPDFGTHYADV